MANKTVITVDVDDAAFERFTEAYADFRSKLDSEPEAWAKLREAAGGTLGDVGDGALSAKDFLAAAAAQAVIIGEELRGAVAAQNELRRSTSTATRGMHDLGKEASGIGKTIFSIATNILKIGAGTLGIGTLLGGFGIGELASAGFNRQKQANSLGVDPGLLASFQVNAQHLLGVNALQSAADSQVDVTKAGALAALGIDFNHARSESPADLAFEELKAARAQWIQAQKEGFSPKQQVGVAAYLNDLGGNEGDIRNATRYTEAQINATQQNVHANAGALGFDEATGAAWTHLKETLDEAGMTIETDLIKALEPLAPQIAEFSKEIVGIVSDGLKQFGDFLAHDVDWKAVGDDFRALSSGLKSLLQLLGILKSDQPKSPEDQKIDNARAQANKDWARDWAWITGTAGNVRNAVGGAVHGVQLGGVQELWKSIGGDPKIAAKMAAIADAESGFNPNATNKNTDGSTDYGLFQINDVHAAELAKAGLKNWKFDPVQNARAALIVSGNGRNNLSPWVTWNEYSGGKNTRAAHVIAADLNSKYGDSDTRLTQQNDPTLAHLIAESKQKSQRRAPQQVSIKVDNSTASRVAASINAIAGI